MARMICDGDALEIFDIGLWYVEYVYLEEDSLEGHLLGT